MRSDDSTVHRTACNSVLVCYYKCILLTFSVCYDLLFLHQGKRRDSEGGESTDMLLAASHSKTSCRASPLLHMDHLHHSHFPSQGSSYSLSKVSSLKGAYSNNDVMQVTCGSVLITIIKLLQQEGASCEDDNPSSLELWPMLSVHSQEDLKPSHYTTQNSHEPDIIVTSKFCL